MPHFDRRIKARIHATKKEPAWLERPENRESMTLFLVGYERLVLLVSEYLSGSTSLKKKHELNKEYIRFQPRVVGLFDKICSEGGDLVALEHYCPPTEDLIMNDAFFTEGNGFQKMNVAYGEIKWFFERMGIATTHSPTDFSDHLKEIDRVLDRTTQETEHVKTTLAGKKIRFDERSKSIIVNGVPCSFRKTRLQVKVARAMFSRRHIKGRGIPWQELFHAISNEEIPDTPGGREIRKLRVEGAVRGINENIQRTFHTDDKLFEWDGTGCLVRNF